MPGGQAAENARGSAVEVRFADGVWHRGRLVERVAGTEPPRWKVQFDDGLLRDDIRIGDPEAPVRFDAVAYGSRVEVRFDGEWYRGTLVELVRGSDVYGVAFEDGDWAEDVIDSSPDVRYVFAGGGAGLGEKRRRGEGAGDGDREESRKRVGTEGKEKKMGAHEKPHLCETCGKSFWRAIGLTLHMQTHRERPCHCKTCGKAFSESGNLAVHMRTHTGEKPYVCNTCGKAFSASCRLTAHLRTHTGEKPYVCEKCGKAFARHSGLTSHMQTHWGIM